MADMIEETPEERLARLGRTVPVTTASSFGEATSVPAVYVAEEWKQQQIFKILGRIPTDENGLGYDLTINNSEV